MKFVSSILLFCIGLFSINHGTYSQIKWQKLDINLNSTVSALCTDSTGNIFLGTLSNGIYRSVDNGDSWTSINNTNEFSWIQDMAVSEKTNTIIVSSSEIYRTSNYGSSWESLGINSFINLTCDDKGVFYAGTTMDGVERSTDDGTSWTKIYSGLTQYTIYSVAFGENNDVFCSSYGQAVYYSSNSGYVWTPVPINPYCINVSALVYNNGILYAGTDLGVYISRDKGNNWVSSDMSSLIHFLKADAYGNIFAATSSNGIYWSNDQGKNWVEINSGLSDLEITAMTISPDGYIYIGSNSGHVYRTLNSITTVNRKSANTLSSLKLEQNYPNPFNPSTVISYQLPVNGHVELKVYDLLGNEVTTLVNETKAAGYYKVKFDGSKLSSGMYIYRINAGNFTQSRKLLLMK